MSAYELRHTSDGRNGINCILCGEVKPLRFVGLFMVCETCFETLTPEVKALAVEATKP